VSNLVCEPSTLDWVQHKRTGRKGIVTYKYPSPLCPDVLYLDVKGIGNQMTYTMTPIEDWEVIPKVVVQKV